MDPGDIVAQFWLAMNTNDFFAAAEWLHDDFVLDWPQTGERIRGRGNFVIINATYPANGSWRFDILQMVEDGDTAVTIVDVTDGVIQARAVTFSTVRDGRIIHQLEYWPDPAPPPEWRSAWVELLSPA